jgi:hypothetical protein
VMGSFQFNGFSFGTVGGDSGTKPDTPPLNSFIVWRGNKVMSNGGFSLASDGLMTPGDDVGGVDGANAAPWMQPYTSEVPSL